MVHLFPSHQKTKQMKSQNQKKRRQQISPTCSREENHCSACWVWVWADTHSNDKGVSKAELFVWIQLNGKQMKWNRKYNEAKFEIIGLSLCFCRKSSFHVWPWLKLYLIGVLWFFFHWASDRAEGTNPLVERDEQIFPDTQSRDVQEGFLFSWSFS